MRMTTTLMILTLALHARGAAAAGPPGGVLKRCPVDMVVSGSICVDRYEASVWRIPDATTGNRALVARLRSGTVTGSQLVGAGAVQLGTSGDDYAPCADNGQNCADDVFAASIRFTKPAADITWFQAQQACKNAGKRLLANAEWQAAVAGTPDPGPDDGNTTCVTLAFAAALAGSRPSCVSSDGVHDMVGNVHEWVSDWVPRSTNCGAWGPGISATNDAQCMVGAEPDDGEPGALVRGGSFHLGSIAGPFYVAGTASPSYTSGDIGFRCAR